jgi:hypothetical protein
VCETCFLCCEQDTAFPSVCMHVVYACVCTCMCVCVYTYIYIYIYIYIYVWMYIFNKHTCTYIHTYKHTETYHSWHVCVNTHTHTHTHTNTAFFAQSSCKCACACRLVYLAPYFHVQKLCIVLCEHSKCMRVCELFLCVHVRVCECVCIVLLLYLDIWVHTPNTIDCHLDRNMSAHVCLCLSSISYMVLCVCSVYIHLCKQMHLLLCTKNRIRVKVRTP